MREITCTSRLRIRELSEQDTSFILELLVYPPIYAYWKWNFEMKRGTVDVASLPLPELSGH